MKCKTVVALANKLPVHVCNLIGGYNKADCFKCQCLKEKEESLMNEPSLLDDGIEEAEAQLLFFRSMFNKDITQLRLNHQDNRSYRKPIDKLFDKQEVKERFGNRESYYQAIKSYCKNNSLEVQGILEYCINIQKLKHMMCNWLLMPNLNSWWEYRNTDYYLRNILSDLIEIYKDQLIKGYEHYCCRKGLISYSNHIVAEIQFG